MPDFPSLAALNGWLETRCRELWAQTLHGSQPRRDRRHMGRRSRATDATFAPVRRLRRIRQARVAGTCLVHLDRNRYSVPASFANRPVSLRAYPERIVVVAGRADRAGGASPAALPAPTNGRAPRPTVYDWRHYLGGWFNASLEPCVTARLSVELPPAFRALQQRLLKTPGGDREMVEILALVLQHDEQAVLAAVELALEAGVPTKTHILNLLHPLGRRESQRTRLR